MKATAHVPQETKTTDETEPTQGNNRQRVNILTQNKGRGREAEAYRLTKGLLKQEVEEEIAKG